MSQLHISDDKDRAIAVIGMACRLPGAADVDAYLHLIRANRSAITQSSDPALLQQGIPAHLTVHPDLVRHFGLLDQVDCFDADYFGIPPARAQRIDPQQRILLELAVAALEHAGYAEESEAGSVGVYTALAHHTYQSKRAQDGAEGFFGLTASDKDYAATRISYALDLTGPSLMVQSACSSSLAATHLATEALLSGQCDIALAGGCSILLPQGAYVAEPGLMLAPDGCCRPYDAEAKGTVPGNGAGLVVLKRLDQALADGDCIHAVIKGSAMANDGSQKVDYLAPGVKGQVRAIGEAWSVANVPPSTLGYIEGHGTGTRLGDPIEIEALSHVFEQFERAGQARPDRCWISSAKGTLGHLNVASGIAGFIRAVLAVREGFIPGTPGFTSPNPEAAFQQTPLRVSPEPRPWDGLRRAGISSFGFGGTNVHVVIEQPPIRLKAPILNTNPQYIPLTAQDAPGLERVRQHLADYLETAPSIILEDLAFTLQRGRRHLPIRAVLRAVDLEDLRCQLRQAGPLPKFTDKTPDALAIKAWLSGEALDWRTLSGAGHGKRIPLPTYPFANVRHWHKQRDAQPLGASGPKAGPERYQPSMTAGGEPGVSGLRHWLLQVFAEALERAPDTLPLDATYDELGIDSLLIVSLTARIRELFPDVRGSLLFEFNTLATLSRHLQSLHPATPPTLDERPHAPDRTQPPKEASGPEPIAIIGQAFRLPGASSADALHDLLDHAQSAISNVPEDRGWSEAMAGRRPKAGFIDAIDRFDALFFGIAPTEARRIDPQARLFLETSWAALENAGYTPTTLKTVLAERNPDTAEVGVFVGVMNMPYRLLAPRADETGQVIQANHWSVANRISYHFDFTGPSLAVDTACSASLTALHLACESLRLGECGAAVVGGVNLVLHPVQQQELMHLGMLSPTDACHTFGATADGFAQGEGVAAAVLKPLSAARADGDRILGLILGSASNANGRTGGYTVPSPSAQARVVRRALKRSGIAPSDIDVIECHGTGTLLGDPIEIAGLCEVFEKEGPSHTVIGSIKSNMGHLESAAGMAGLAKVLLQFERQIFFPSLHADPINRELKLESTGFTLHRTSTSWSPSETKSGTRRPRRAGLSGFGAGGSNAHLVLEEAPTRTPSSRPQREEQPIVLSAFDPEALERIRVQLIQYLNAHPKLAETPESLADLAYTLATGREPLQIRSGFIAWDRPSLLEGLSRSRQSAGTVRETSTEAHGYLTRWMQHDTPALAAWWSRERRHRIALPTYPFFGPRLWFQSDVAPSSRPAGSPWIDSATQIDDRSFQFSLPSAVELMDQHKVNGAACLPGIVSASLTLIAAERLGLSPVGLAGVIWKAPIQPKSPSLTLTLRFLEKNRFRLLSAPDEEARVEGRVLSGGTTKPPVIRAPIPLLDSVNAKEMLDQEEVRHRLVAAGLSHGPVLRAIHRLAVLEQEILAELIRPPAAKDGLAHWRPCPSILDSALQAACVLLLDEPRALMPVPVGMDRFWLYHADWPDRVRIRARLLERSDGFARMDITMADGSGQSLCLIQGLTARILPAPTNRASALPLFTPFWQDGELSTQGGLVPIGATVTLLAPTPDHTLANALKHQLEGRDCSIQSLDEFLNDDQAQPDCLVYIHPAEQGPRDSPQVLEVLRLLKALVRQTESLQLILLTHRVQTLAGDTGGAPLGAAAIGLARTADQENPRLRVHCLDLESAFDPEPVLRTLADPLGLPMAWRQGRPLYQRIQPVSWPIPAPACLSAQDHVLVVGGAGGIGLAVAERWSLRPGARLTLLGRRSPDVALEGVHLPVGTCYLSVDVTDARALTQAIAEAERLQGPVTAAIHAAIIMADAAIHNMSEEHFMPAFEVKRSGLYHLVECLSHRPLRWIAVFSSVNSFITNAGQSNYVAGCSVMDALGLDYARSKGLPVKIINWGYWGEVGRVASEPYRARMARLGVHSIGANEGLDALECILANGASQVLAIHAEAPVMARLGLASAAVEPSHPPARIMEDREVFKAACQSAKIITDQAVNAMRGVTEDYRMLDQLAVDALARWWFDQAMPSTGTRNELASALGLSPSHGRQFDALIDMLVRHDYLRQNYDNLERGAKAPLPAGAIGAAREAFLAQSPEFRAHLELLDACLLDYAGVLRATILPTEVLFPDMSMSRVEGMYRGNRMVDHFNTKLAAAAAGAQGHMPTNASFRVLEFGSGTGGTSQAVLPKLLPGASYDYTDISSGFLLHGKKQFKSAYPFVNFKLLDLENPADPSLYPAASYDLAFGSNVIHATCNLSKSLAHVANLIRPGGLLMLYEMVANHEFVTITFGLLPGWWLSEDSRLPHGPLLDPKTWRMRLSESGFDRVEIFGQPEAETETQVTHALIIARKGDPSTTESDIPKAQKKPLMRSRLRRNRNEQRPSDNADISFEQQVLVCISGSLEIPEDRIDPARSLAEYGADSILSVQLIRDLNDRFRVELKPTALFSHASVRALSAHLLELRPELAVPRYLPTQEAPLPPSLFEGNGDIDKEAIAIIGMAGRFPGADSVEAFDQLLREGRSAVRPVPPDRWDHRLLEDPNPLKPGHTVCPNGGFLDHAYAFDPVFFGLSPAEALAMDPQQRLFLMAAWHALEDAALSPDLLQDRLCGVYSGNVASDYDRLLEAARHPRNAQTFMGSAASMLPARIAYHLNLKGPVLSIDTACSSALVAIAEACESLHAGRCELALAGGVAVMSTPQFMVVASNAGMLSPSGQCHTLDAKADGFVPGEAVSVFVLKRLSDALADGNPIAAVIRGWGVNQDGASNGITAPSAPAQTALIRRLHERFTIDPATIDYVEMHGTGTRLGDPVEVEGLIGALGTSPAPCGLGSVKSNLGHTLAAAGAVGLTKVVLALKAEILPATLNFKTLNPAIDLSQTAFYPLSSARPWTRQANRPRRAGVSAFGFAGTNAHVVVEEAPIRITSAGPAMGPWLFAISAKTPSSLQMRAKALAVWLRDRPATPLDRLSYTLWIGRAHFNVRAATIADRPEALIGWLETLAADAAHPGEWPSGPLQPFAASYLEGTYPMAPLPGMAPGGIPLSIPGYAFETHSYRPDLTPIQISQLAMDPKLALAPVQPPDAVPEPQIHQSVARYLDALLKTEEMPNG